MPNSFYSNHLLKSMDLRDKFSLPFYNSIRPNDTHRRDLKKQIYTKTINLLLSSLGGHMELGRYEQSRDKQFVEKRYDTGMG